MAKEIRTNLEILSSVNGESGLKLKNLVSGDKKSSYNGIIGIDGQGNVVKINDSTLNPTTTNSLTNAGLTVTSDVNGVSSNVDLSNAVNDAINAKTDSVVSDVQTGHKIATHTAVDGTAVEINETVTGLGEVTLDGNTLSIRYTNENGVEETKTVSLQGLVTTDINVDEVTWDAATNVLKVKETDGTEHDVDLSEFSITTDTESDGSIVVKQEGKTKFTVPAQYGFKINNDVIAKDENVVFIAENGVKTEYDAGTNTVKYGIDASSASAGDVLTSDASGNVSFKKPSTERYVNTYTPTANIATEHTHALAAGENIIVQVYDATTKERIGAEVKILTATTFEVTVTTNDEIKVVAL